MDDEMFITHLLNSLPQAEYKGAILAIKEKLRRSTYDLAEIEQILEDKYQSMKYVKGWEEEEDVYALFGSLPNKKGNKTVQRKMWLIWKVWTQSSKLPPTRKVARKRFKGKV